MCNANDSIISKVEELMELRKMAEELQNQMDAITDDIKAYMGDEESDKEGENPSRRKSKVSLSNVRRLRVSRA